jgi:hypothetical protein
MDMKPPLKRPNAGSLISGGRSRSIAAAYFLSRLSISAWKRSTAAACSGGGSLSKASNLASSSGDAYMLAGWNGSSAGVLGVDVARGAFCLSEALAGRFVAVVSAAASSAGAPLPGSATGSEVGILFCAAAGVEVGGLEFSSSRCKGEGWKDRRADLIGTIVRRGRILKLPRKADVPMRFKANAIGGGILLDAA